MISLILVYDSHCGPCTKFKNIVRFLDPRRKIAFVPLLAADQSGLLDELDRETRYGSFHLIVPGRAVASGADALPVLFGILAGGSRMERGAMSIPFGFQAVSSVYKVLSRLHDTGSCEARGRRELPQALIQRPDGFLDSSSPELHLMACVNSPLPL